MKDRIPKYAGRIRLTPVSGQSDVYVVERADEPLEVGTPLNKNTFLSAAVDEALGLTEEATPSDAILLLLRKIEEMGLSEEDQAKLDSIKSAADYTTYRARRIALKTTAETPQNGDLLGVYS